MRQRTHVVVCAILLFAGMCAMENCAVKARPRDPADAKRDSSVYALAGQFRTVFANLLWIKADQYHHEFIQHNPNWSQNTELLGLLNLITNLDPHFIEAYSSGAIIYANGLHNNHRALAYLLEGIRNNPTAWDLHRMAAIMYVRRFNDPAKALPHAQRAAYYCNDDFLRPRMYQLVRTIAGLQKSTKQGPSQRSR